MPYGRESVNNTTSKLEKMFNPSLGGAFILVSTLFLLSCVTFYLALVIESGKLSLGLEEMRKSKRSMRNLQPHGRPYQTEMDEDEKYGVRMEYETKFNQVVIDEERGHEERMNEEIEDIFESSRKTDI